MRERSEKCDPSYIFCSVRWYLYTARGLECFAARTLGVQRNHTVNELDSKENVILDKHFVFIQYTELST